MRKLLAVLAITMLGCGQVLADAAATADPPPSDASVQRLLELTNSRKLIDSMGGMVDKMTQQAMQQAMQGQALTPQDREAFDDMRSQLAAVVKGQISWEKIEPMIAEVYKESFSQSEVDSMIGFYGSPAGQAVVAKMPLVMQNTMQAVQAQIQPMLQKMQQIQQKTVAQIKANHAKSGGTAAKNSTP